MTRLRAALLASALALAASPALAHHSRSNFDLETFVDVEGTVTEFSWRNPHAYVVVEAADETGALVEHTFELNATPILMRYGWDETALATGDHVRIRANPDRNASKRFYYTAVIVKDDGTELWSWDGGERIRPPAPTTGSQNFAGVWRNAPRDVLGANAPDAVLRNDLPVTPAGQAQLDAFDPDEDPTLACEPYTLPGIVAAPYPFEIVRESDELIRIRYELEGEERLVHLGMSEHPADVAPSHMGHSIGWLSDKMLVVDTANFAPVNWGLGQGLDSSADKRVVEIYSLLNDGKSMSVLMTMEDPAYLAEPVTRAYAFNLHEGYEISDYHCDPDAARRHLTAGGEE